MDSNSLGDVLAAELTASWGDHAAPPETLLAAIEAAWRAGCAAWPGVELALEPFVAHLARHLDRSDPAGALRALHTDDLYLALACGRRDPSALLAFEQLCADDLRLALARVSGSERSVDDVRQAVWQRLFVGDDGERPKILEYSGQGRLKGWFRVVVVRALLDEQRREKVRPTPSDDDRFLGLRATERDPELEYLRRVYTHEFREAFERAARALEPEDRNALRAYYVKELTIDQIAAMLGLHRATAARRVAAARERLMAGTRRDLATRLQLSRGELESVMRLIESGLHVSMHRVLD